jgi:hypothetical protein
MSRRFRFAYSLLGFGSIPDQVGDGKEEGSVHIAALTRWTTYSSAYYLRIQTGSERESLEII